MLWSCLELLKMSCWMSFWVATFLTTITVCRGLCNLGRLENVRTDQSSTYKYDQTFHNIELTADRAVNGRFLNHSGGDCAGTDVSKKHTQAWWNISLPDPAIIYKINLMFRENNIRHYGYYVFINKEDINIEGLTSLTPVYHEENEKHPGVQNIIMFPGGIQGKQMYIYQNKSKPINDNVDQQNNVLDICEVEIWGCFNFTEDVNCTCSQNESDTPLPKAILSSIVAWPNNSLTLICHQGNVKLGDKFKPKLNLTHNNNTISFTCFDACSPKDAYNAYNASTTDVQNPDKNVMLSVGDYVTFTCKNGHRFESGNLTRVCQENRSWSGEEPTCKRCECPCKRLASQNFIKDPIDLQQRIEEIKKFLAVNRSELSAFKRKKISSYDGRASSTGIGMTLGVGVITFVIGAIVCSDLLTCKNRNQRRMFRKTL
ncbi:uncharacterized protein [Magallana gigas]|uniref:uncharacterized protein isoform X1 n=1 Tax=Magallana gigas TaxID=29159 RepID=UPI00333ED08A